MRFEHDMRFEYEKDHEEFEANLPGDLALMGEQLFDDAEYLCERYPTSAKTPVVASAAMVELLGNLAERSVSLSCGSDPLDYSVVNSTDTQPAVSILNHGSPRESEATASPQKVWVRWTRRLTAAAALVFCAVGVWAYQSNAFQQNAFQLGADETAGGGLSSQLVGLLPSNGSDLLLLQSEFEGPPSISTAEFESISSSEQEAVLDLLEDGGMLQASLSM